MEPSTPPTGAHADDPEDVDIMPTPMRRVRRRAASGVHLPIAAFLIYRGTIGLIPSVPDTVVEHLLPAPFVYAWSLALIIGGIIVITGTLTDRVRLESSGHAIHLAGIGLYAATYATTLSVNAVVSVLVLGAVTLSRMHVLAQAREARREAAYIAHGGGRR